ncbi:hypothetical protein ACFODZ_07510 [Marinicella sediminis]|uniref:Uncharacterized protein n=1 Tax=Marinicella sediminis TaxID=1792834 RepID=A0ABV7JB28_9GAMM|nr:hypothetical protein [Marinicella sediminis]
MSKFLIVTGLCVISGSAFAEFSLNPFKGGFIKGYTETCIKDSEHNLNKAKELCGCMAQGNYDEFSWLEWMAFYEKLEQGEEPDESFMNRLEKVRKACEDKFLRPNLSED